MKTRQKDFTNCHPKIAEALKQLQEVYCNVWDRDHDNKKDWVTDYLPGKYFPYIVGNTPYKYAEPVQTVRRVRPAEEIIQWLLDNGYKYSGGVWHKVGYESFLNNMFEFCGGSDGLHVYCWLPEWLEEVCE